MASRSSSNVKAGFLPVVAMANRDASCISSESSIAYSDTMPGNIWRRTGSRFCTTPSPSPRWIQKCTRIGFSRSLNP